MASRPLSAVAAPLITATQGRHPTAVKSTSIRAATQRLPLRARDVGRKACLADRESLNGDTQSSCISILPQALAAMKEPANALLPSPCCKLILETLTLRPVCVLPLTNPWPASGATAWQQHAPSVYHAMAPVECLVHSLPAKCIQASSRPPAEGNAAAHVLTCGQLKQRRSSGRQRHMPGGAAGMAPVRGPEVAPTTEPAVARPSITRQHRRGSRASALHIAPRRAPLGRGRARRRAVCATEGSLRRPQRGNGVRRPLLRTESGIELAQAPARVLRVTRAVACLFWGSCHATAVFDRHSGRWLCIRV